MKIILQLWIMIMTQAGDQRPRNHKPLTLVSTPVVIRGMSDLQVLLWSGKDFGADILASPFQDTGLLENIPDWSLPAAPAMKFWTLASGEKKRTLTWLSSPTMLSLHWCNAQHSRRDYAGQRQGQGPCTQAVADSRLFQRCVIAFYRRMLYDEKFIC